MRCNARKIVSRTWLALDWLNRRKIIDRHIKFIDLEKSYDTVPRYTIWKTIWTPNIRENLVKRSYENNWSNAQQMLKNGNKNRWRHNAFSVTCQSLDRICRENSRCIKKSLKKTVHVFWNENLRQNTKTVSLSLSQPIWKHLILWSLDKTNNKIHWR